MDDHYLQWIYVLDGLTLLKGFPRQKGYISKLVEYFVRLCRPQIKAGEFMNATEIAAFVVDRMCAEGEWGGLIQINRVYFSHFSGTLDRKLEVVAQSYKTLEERLGPLVIECAVCGDIGITDSGGNFEWCGCGQGQKIRCEEPDMLELYRTHSGSKGRASRLSPKETES